jgi:tRNA (mo5U34)-methyltransferase
MDRAQMIERMNSMPWYHKIELAPGIVTPGNDWEALWDPMLAYHRAVNFAGKRVLEIGCWDGYWSFEAEKLGAAEIWATDDMSQRRNQTRTVPFAIECLGSRVRYRDDVSVYAVETCFDEKFDIVIFYGVLYHLRYPALALAKLRQVLRPGGLLLLETAVLLDTDDTLMRWGHSRIYAGDRSTWNAPSVPCLRLLLESSYFDVTLCEAYLRQGEELKIGRGYANAVAVERADAHIVPDHFLHAFDTANRQPV